jgi:hypothetical protein
MCNTLISQGTLTQGKGSVQLTSTNREKKKRSTISKTVIGLLFANVNEPSAIKR